MKANYIESVRQSLKHAQKMVEECIMHILEPYGEEGLELNDKTDHSFSVIYEEFPNEFEKITAIRVLGCILKVKTDKNNEWRKLYINNTDIAFLLDEIESAIRATEED